AFQMQPDGDHHHRTPVPVIPRTPDSLRVYSRVHPFGEAGCVVGFPDIFPPLPQPRGSPESSDPAPPHIKPAIAGKPARYQRQPELIGIPSPASPPQVEST